MCVLHRGRQGFGFGICPAKYMCLIKCAGACVILIYRNCVILIYRNSLVSAKVNCGCHAGLHLLHTVYVAAHHWVAVNEITIMNKETLSFATCPYYGNLN